jgi:outer membrane protein
MKIIVKNRLLQILFLVLFLIPESYISAQSQLSQYLEEGLKNNLVLQQKDIGLDKAVWSLKEANSLFLPSLNLNASYISGQGGRYINFPVGDMLNPVYSTLNAMTKSNNFPHIENAEAYLNPHNFYDAHGRITLPLINTDLIYNKQIQNKQVSLQEYEIEIYKRELVKNIKIAYYNYQMAASALKVYKGALEVVNKNVQVNQSLLENGKGLHAAVLRSQSEVENIQSQLITSENNLRNAQRYFNFLLNRSLDSPVLISQVDSAAIGNAEKLVTSVSIQKREELGMVATAINLRSSQLKMNRTFWVPKMNTFLDLGSQASDWVYNNKSRYYLVGVQFDMPVFNGFRNNYKIKRAQLDLRDSELKQQQVSQQLQVGAEVAASQLSSSLQDYKSGLKQQEAARAYFRLIDTGYREGRNSLIEFLDARNQLTTSELRVNINFYKVLQSMAEVERETAAYVF